MSKNIIKECLNYLYETNESFKAWGENDSFIEKKDEILIKNILEIHINKWNSKIIYNSWSFINKYNEYLIDSEYNFEDIEEPDCFIKDFDSKDKLIDIQNKKIYIDNKIKKYFNEFKEDEKGSYLDFNINSVFLIYESIKNNNFKIDLDSIKKINIFLNSDSFDLEKIDLFNDKLKIKLRNFQKIGVLFLLLNRRVILGDEMGLGKTIQSISAITISNSFPCLVISPSSLKLNWLSEVYSVTKDKTALVVKNKKSFEKDSDFYITNYESLHNFIDIIKEKKFKSIILDESHYIKNQEAKRTININKIINNIDFRFALTGTCIINNPIDLISPLKLINQFDHFGNEDKFIEMYCNPKKTKWGLDKSGSSNLEILSKKLRETALIRRTKKEVLKELPDKVISVLPLELSNKKEYKLILKDFSKLNKVEKIGKLEKLRQFVANDKLIFIENWIDNFLNNGEKIVVFTHHISIQNKLIKKYPTAARIISTDSEDIREYNKNRFQNEEDCKIIICSLKTASLGYTLTAASNVLFVEFDWCSTTNKQAEDRCHRIGQKDSVNAWYFIVENSIEEHIWNVSLDKDLLINSVYNDENKKDFLEHYLDKDISIEEKSLSVLNEVINLIEKEEIEYYQK